MFEWVKLLVLLFGVFFGPGIIAFIVGFAWQAGKNKAVVSKKVCDVCFRDIQRLRNTLDSKKPPEEAI